MSRYGLAVEIADDVPEELRPRIFRKLGIPLEWDKAVDALPLPLLRHPSAFFVLGCRAYRAVRPKAVGDRCAFEPSCSRYAELSFRRHGVWTGLVLTCRRLSKCRGNIGGRDIPPGIGDGFICVEEMT